MSTTDDTTTPPTDASVPAAPRRRRAASRAAGPPVDATTAGDREAPAGDQQAAAAPVKKATATRTTAKKATARKTAPAAQPPPAAAAQDEPVPPVRRTRAKKTAPVAEAAPAPQEAGGTDSPEPAARRRGRKLAAPAFSTVEAATLATDAEAPAPVALMFQAPDPATTAPPRRARKTAAERAAAAAPVEQPDEDDEALEDEPAAEVQDERDQEHASEESHDGGPDDESGDGPRRRRRRGGRGRRRRGDEDGAEPAEAPAAADAVAEPVSEPATDADEDSDGEGGSSRRRRRRRRKGGDDGRGTDDPPNTVVRVRDARARGDEITAVKGSTRLEAKKQRRREGREAGRRRPSILTEAEFLARREAVERVMVVRELTDRTQIAVLEDGVLVEHYVNRSTGASMIGNVYLGKVQNVLPSMEAAFVDVGRGRNAVLYAGEVNWDAAGLDGQPRRIESALKSGDSVLVQVTKDPIGHKGARLTSQISLPGRFLVYVPEGQMTGISRKLPDTERTRLKNILRDIVPEDAGVIVRTAAEGASEEELSRDVARLAEQWTAIADKARSASAPALLHGEPDLAIKVVRDIFNEDFHKLVVSGAGASDPIEDYVRGVAPDLLERLEKWVGTDEVFHAYRVDEQLAKALDRKVWLPSGGSLVIDRTEAMTVVDVNTGKFTGSGGNLEETVTRNNLEAAEEIVRQLRLRDIGGIIVVDFIDMVLESNRDLVLRRLLECLGRDRTKHQVAEVTSLGLVQMTRKRIGQGLLEVFSEPCEHCNGRGVIVHAEPVESKGHGDSASVATVVRSASASLGAAKVHAAARRAAAAGEEPAAEDATAEPTPDEVEAKPRAGRGRRRAATRAQAAPDAGAHDAAGADGGDGAAPADDGAAVAPVLAAAPAAAAVPAEPVADGPTPPARTRGARRRATRSAGPASLDPAAPSQDGAEAVTTV